MATTHEDRHFPYRESAGTVPLRPGGAEPDRSPRLDPGFNWGLLILTVVILFGLVYGMYQASRIPVEPEQRELPGELR